MPVKISGMLLVALGTAAGTRVMVIEAFRDSAYGMWPDEMARIAEATVEVCVASEVEADDEEELSVFFA